MSSWTEVFERSPEDDIVIEGIPVMIKAWQPSDGSSITDYKKISALYTVSDPCGRNDILYDCYGNVSNRTLLSEYVYMYTDAIPVNNPT